MTQPAADGADPADLNRPALEAQLHGLEDEVASLRNQLREHEVRQDMLERLREANQSLVLATLTAQTLRDEAEDANRRQNEFLAMLAHELRNPLAPISMAASMLEKIPDASPQLLRLQDIIGRQVGHMARLLDDLLDAARISSGKISLQIRPVSLAEIVTQALETVQPRIDGRRQHLDITLPDEPLVLDGDPVRLAQVFSNLLGNASKFTPDQGHIRLQATVVASPESPEALESPLPTALTGLAEETNQKKQATQPARRIAIRIEDDGVGIALEVMPHIFDLFTQGPRSLARSEGGLGVGLNVVRHLVSMHGGEVGVESPGLGHGSIFTVVLPLSARSADAQPAASAPARPPARRILLVEDNPDTCETLKDFLVHEGHVVSTAGDGRVGLSMASRNAYDVLLCDIGLPGMDGYDVATELRRRHAVADAPGAGVPYLIALSGYGQADDRSRAAEAGFDRYFVKPVSPDELRAALSTLGEHGSDG